MQSFHHEFASTTAIHNYWCLFIYILSHFVSWYVLKNLDVYWKVLKCSQSLDMFYSTSSSWTQSGRNLFKFFAASNFEMFQISDKRFQILAEFCIIFLRSMRKTQRRRRKMTLSILCQLRWMYRFFLDRIEFLCDFRRRIRDFLVKFFHQHRRNFFNRSVLSRFDPRIDSAPETKFVYFSLKICWNEWFSQSN